MKGIICIIATICTVLHFSFGDTICELKTCHCVKLKVEEEEKTVLRVNCLNHNFTQMPQEVKWPEKLYIIDFKSNKIEDILEFMVSHPDLRILRFSDNWISNIEARAFKTMTHLIQLYLDHNRLSRLHPETFGGLELLELLDISNNDIRHFPTNIFENFVALEDLRIGDNPLLVLDPYVFKPLESLKFLDASHIGCHALDVGVFHSNVYLERVDLSNNKFEKIPNKELALLHDNPTLGIRYLYMDGNQIKVLDDTSFTHLDKLVEIHLNNMYTLQEIKAHTFSQLKELLTVRISSNPSLSKIDSSAFEGLFKGTPNEDITLKEVHLDNNNLAQLPRSLLPWSKLQCFSLQGNHWKCDCKMKWLNDVKYEMSEKIANDIRCSSPKSLANKRIIELSEDDYICDKSTAVSSRHISDPGKSSAIIWGIVTTIVAIVCLSIIIFVVRKKSPYKLATNKKQGIIRYRKAQSQPDNMEPVEL